MDKNIFQWVKEEETRYGLEIEVMENWYWCMKDHIKNSILFKYGKFISQTNDLKTKQPFKNIIYPLLEMRHKAEDIDLTDVDLYVDDDSLFHLSFLVKKFHDDKYVVEHDLDTFFDETLEEKIDLGGTLVRKSKDGPVYEPLESIAFCDQTDILSGPIAFKIDYSPDELQEMSSAGWGDEKNGATTTLADLIEKAEAVKEQDHQAGRTTATPGKYIQVYRIHGSMPVSWLKDSDVQKIEDNKKYVRQLQVIAFYSNKEGTHEGVTLYRAREYENPFKVHLSGKKLRNRALAYGGVEELFDPQIWTNYSEIQKKEAITALGKVIRVTDDEGLATRNKISDLDNNEFLTIRQGAKIDVLQNPTTNVQLFNEWMQEWDTLAQTTSGATDALLGKTPPSPTPFALQNLVVEQGQGLHDRRRGKFASFIADIYQDWIIPDIASQITKGTKFLATLSPDEMDYVADCVARSQVHKEETEQILNGGDAYTEEERLARTQEVRQAFSRGGNKKFIEILKGEFDGVELKVKVNVAGKQKDLAMIVERMTNVMRFVMSTFNPQTGTFAALEDPKMAKVFHKLIEYSGLEPIDFGYAGKQPVQQQMPAPQQPVPNQPILA